MKTERTATSLLGATIVNTVESPVDRELGVKTLGGEDAGSVTLAGKVFNLPIRKDIVHRAVVWLQAGKRRGTACTKRRSEITASKRKLFKQKGTGRARHGSLSANIFRGGYKWNGPKPKDWSHEMNRKERRLAIRIALSSKAAEGKVFVIDEAKLEVPKTKVLRQLLDSLNLGSVLLIDEELDPNVKLAARNLPDVDALTIADVHVYNILHQETIVITKRAVEALQSKLLAPIKR
eukprot:CAMPEP_0184336150 /NCGR_PEP_ID=MMETSP1089-20130417/4551_1 /TAXON_ID=38269 ORGANISM="Gloeochaete wittrockiana, Strain SAG46.84" /NCGR_SAMPLE_ID=MMETSP1089 /ASSEMBLY_ACC=CAM_ASM_000445 /LENGTH=234 /DNA_ID=CAMNT_0026661097 /DNA_START=302 /DNA_END=1006 /DNA_ORIENTATION=+